MKLIVGLGNPGKEYEHSRHNMGYDVIDLFASSLGCDIDREGFKGLYTKTLYLDETIILLKPTTYMNLSGDSVRMIMEYFKIDVDDLFVIYDDMDIMPGHIKLKIKGSSAGHNGIKSIIENIKTEEFKRIRKYAFFSIKIRTTTRVPRHGCRLPAAVSAPPHTRTQQQKS